MELKSRRVLVVARTRLYREGLAQLLDARENIEVVGKCAGLDAAASGARLRRPDIVLLDIGLATQPAAVAAVVEAVAPARVVAFGLADDEETVICCAEGGVLGYVPCEASIDELVEVLDAVVRDELIVSPRVAATLLRRVGALAQAGNGGGPPVRLTARETQIMALVDDGLSNKEIAARLQIGLATVKNHVHNVLDKLGATGRADAAARVRRSGRFRPEPTAPRAEV